MNVTSLAASEAAARSDLTQGQNEPDVLRLAASLERGSEHPLGKAIVKGAGARNFTLPDAEGFAAIPGHGVSGRIDGRNILFGNGKLMRDRGITRRIRLRMSDEHVPRPPNCRIGTPNVAA